jgi:hypothetical protein
MRNLRFSGRRNTNVFNYHPEWLTPIYIDDWILTLRNRILIEKLIVTQLVNKRTPSPPFIEPGGSLSCRHESAKIEVLCDELVSAVRSCCTPRPIRHTTTPRRLSATGYSVYSQLPFTSGKRFMHLQPEDTRCRGDKGAASHLPVSLTTCVLIGISYDAICALMGACNKNDVAMMK